MKKKERKKKTHAIGNSVYKKPKLISHGKLSVVLGSGSSTPVG